MAVFFKLLLTVLIFFSGKVFAESECDALQKEYGEYLSEKCQLESCYKQEQEVLASDNHQFSKAGFKGHITHCRNKAIEVQECVNTCTTYLHTFATGCSLDTSQCSNHCLDPGFSTESLRDSDKMAHFNQASGVDNCVTEKVEQYKTLYMQECVSMLEEINKIKPNELLCPGATDLSDSQSKCNEFCQERFTEHFDNEEGVNATDCYNSYRRMKSYRTGMRAGGFTEGETIISKSCLVLINDHQGEINRAINKLQDQIISGNGELKGDFSWLVCKKGEEQSCEEDLKLAMEEAVEVCANLQSEALECCHSPEQCVGGGLATALDGLGKMNVGISALKGLKKQCKDIQQTYALYGSMQGAMAAQCTRTANACKEGCAEEQQKVAEKFRVACNHDIRIKAKYDENEHTCNKILFDYYSYQYRSSVNAQEINISRVPEECSRTGREANRNIQDMSTNLGASLMASMKECGIAPDPVEWERPTPKPLVFPKPTVPTPTPAPITPPTPYMGGGGREPNNPKRPGRAGLPKDDPLNLPADPLTGIPPLEDDPPAEGAGAPGGMSGLLGGGGGSSGTGGFGLGGGGGGDNSPGMGGGDEDSAKSNKILHGYAGGKFAGYGSGGDANQGRQRLKRGSKKIKNKRKAVKLNLKKILPKGKQLNHKVGKYGSPHDNIFQRLSHRVQWMCKTNKISCK